MMKKIRMNCTATLDETFADFLLSRRAKGLAEKTLESYSSQWKAVARHLDTETDISALQKADLDDMIVSMRDAGLSPNSINSYTRVLKSFFSWCNEQGLTRLNIPLYKAEETVKETYSDAELTALLKKPDIRKTTFAEYRDWVIINFLLNCGSRAATVRAIQIRDVDLDGGVVFYRHTKNRKAQVIPLCSPMVAILREYGRYRGGEPTDYLFCTETGTQLTENGLRQSIARYNTRRGVQKTSIHLFRHTFARKYLIDCGGDAFTLQKLLGTFHPCHDEALLRHLRRGFDEELRQLFPAGANESERRENQNGLPKAADGLPRGAWVAAVFISVRQRKRSGKCKPPAPTAFY